MANWQVAEYVNVRTLFSFIMSETPALDLVHYLNEHRVYNEYTNVMRKRVSRGVAITHSLHEASILH